MKMRDNPNMESFYEENTQLSGQTPLLTSGGALSNGATMKRPLTLDLNGKDLHPAKRLRFNNNASVISTPDLQMLKMVSPELEKFIMNGNPMATPTPGLTNYPQKEESLEAKEVFAKGFEEALTRLHKENVVGPVTNAGGKQHQQQQQQQQQVNHNNNSSSILNNNSLTTSSSSVLTLTSAAPIMTTTISTNNSLSMSGGTVTYTNLDVPLPLGVPIKEEPQTVPNSPSFCPVDMDDQERQKLERKRQRNRVAASKCRKRKLERISKLEDKVKLLKGENSDLGGTVNNLRQHVMQLKQQIIEHVNAGCRIPFQQF